jgi:hypothetical protein
VDELLVTDSLVGELLKRPGEVWVPGTSIPGDADRSTGSYIE